MLRGKFTQHLRGDKYEFEDEAGTAITAVVLSLILPEKKEEKAA